MKMFRTFAVLVIMSGPVALGAQAQDKASPEELATRTTTSLQKALGLDERSMTLVSEILLSAERDVAVDRAAIREAQNKIDERMDMAFELMSRRLTPEQQRKLKEWRDGGNAGMCCDGAAKGEALNKERDTRSDTPTLKKKSGESSIRR
ncbi:MAG: hypothetical protein H6597_03970 [Flavobacteriales bacterium]|nr:hypothetical protein [Flavobacteriales bacterium]MCB9193667.1 hypothetical protein [Flavobacteriales bacterium]